MTLDPERLIEQASARDERAIELLLEKHLPTVRAVVTHRMGKVLRSREESLDLVQSACLRALRERRPEGLEDERRFRAWLLRVVENKLVDRYRMLTAQKRRHDLEAPLPSGDSLAAAAVELGTPSVFVQRKELVERVREAMQRLDPVQREAIQLHEFEACSYAEMGGRLGLTEKQARLRVTKAKLSLAHALRALDGDDPLERG